MQTFLSFLSVFSIILQSQEAVINQNKTRSNLQLIIRIVNKIMEDAKILIYFYCQSSVNPSNDPFKCRPKYLRQQVHGCAVFKFLPILQALQSYHTKLIKIQTYQLPTCICSCITFYISRIRKLFITANRQQTPLLPKYYHHLYNNHGFFICEMSQ